MQLMLGLWGREGSSNQVTPAETSAHPYQLPWVQKWNSLYACFSTFISLYIWHVFNASNWPARGQAKLLSGLLSSDYFVASCNALQVLCIIELHYWSNISPKFQFAKLFVVDCIVTYCILNGIAIVRESEDMLDWFYCNVADTHQRGVRTNNQLREELLPINILLYKFNYFNPFCPKTLSWKFDKIWKIL